MYRIKIISDYLIILTGMRLLLTSDGLTSGKLVKAFKDLNSKSPKETKILMISTGPETPGDKARESIILDHITNFKKPMLDVGIPESNFTTLLMSSPDHINLDEIDIIFICGGNTYFYLHLLKKLNLFLQIIDFVNKDGVYIGVSAGSILAGPDIKSAGIGGKLRRSDFVAGQSDLTSFGFVDFTILPHFNQENRIEVLKEISELNLGYPCLVLNDGEGYLVFNRKIELI